jgi:hypothetical protein
MIAEAGAAISGSTQSKKRGERAQEDLAKAYQPMYEQASQAAYDQAMLQSMNVARSGGTSGSQTSGMRAAQQMAPASAAQAELAGHQAASNYAQLQNQYRQQQLAEDQYKNEIIWGSVGESMVGLGDILGALSDERTKNFTGGGQQNQSQNAYNSYVQPLMSSGGGSQQPQRSTEHLSPFYEEDQGGNSGVLGGVLGAIISDERTKAFNREVGKSVGYADSSVMSDARSKELEAQNQALQAQLVRAQNPPTTQQKERQLSADSANRAIAQPSYDDRVAARAREMTGGPERYGTSTGNTLRAIFGESGAIAKMQDASRAKKQAEAYEYNRRIAEEEVRRQMAAEQDRRPLRFDQDGYRIGTRQGQGQPEPGRPLTSEEQAMDERLRGEIRQAANTTTPEEAQAWGEWLSRQGAGPLPQRGGAPARQGGAPAQRPVPARASARPAPAAQPVPQRVLGAPEGLAYDPRENQGQGPAMSQEEPKWMRLGGALKKLMSDEESKDRGRIREGDGLASEVFRKTPGYAYEYKDEFQGQPGTEPGQQYGIMAQDLERSRMGRTVVDEDENGMKRVDTERLTLLNSAGINEILQRLDALEGRLNGKGS